MGRPPSLSGSLPRGKLSPAKILQVETKDDPRRPVHRALPAMICPQTSVKVGGGYRTAVAHTLAMALDVPTMDDDLRTALAAHEIVLDEECVEDQLSHFIR